MFELNFVDILELIFWF